MTDIPYDQYDAHQYDDLDPTDSVVRAWSAKWVDPEWQDSCDREIRELMPALARSLDRLVEMAVIRDRIEKSRLDRIEESLGTDEQVAIQEALLLDELIGLPAVEEISLDGEVEAHSGEEVVLSEDEIYLNHLMASAGDGADQAWATNEAWPSLSMMTCEELGDRGRRASERLQAWGRTGTHLGSCDRERSVREQVIIRLNNMDGVTQPMIGRMLNVSGSRVSQLVRNYYNKLEFANQDERRRQ